MTIECFFDTLSVVLDRIKDFFGFGEKARAYIIVQWNIHDGALHFHVERCARSVGLNGWMRVVKKPMYEYIEMEVEGTKYRVNKLIERLRLEAPPSSKASGLDISWKTFSGKYHDFQTRII